MLHKILKFPLPSILADSSNSVGIPWKNVRIIMMFHTATAFGIIMTQNVFNMPKSRINKYVGINPPLKNMVKTINAMKKPRPLKSFLDNGYAANMVITTFNAVPATVYFTVLMNPLIISLFLNTFSYASTVNSFGHNHISPEITYCGLLNDALTTNSNG